MLSRLYEESDEYRQILCDGKYDVIKINKDIHYGTTDRIHFNGFMMSYDETLFSPQYHFYINEKERKIYSLSKLDIISVS